MEEASRRLFDFNSPEELGRWEILNGGTAGGVSESRLMASAESIATFRGTLSLEHGGFASARTYPQTFGLSGYMGLRILVRGDGKRYGVQLRTDDKEDAVAYESRFDTKARIWMSIRLPFSGFVPAFRGHERSVAPKLLAGSIRRISFFIADEQEGPFRLDIDWIEAYGEQNST